MNKGSVSDILFKGGTFLGTARFPQLTDPAVQDKAIEQMRKVLYQRVRQLHVQKYPYNDFLYQDYE